MQSAEEFIRFEIGSTVDDWLDQGEAVHLIAARDAEVRADERAKALAGFEWEPDDCSMEFRTHGQNCQCFGPRTGPRVGRWVGPWEPTP